MGASSKAGQREAGGLLRSVTLRITVLGSASGWGAERKHVIKISALVPMGISLTQSKIHLLAQLDYKKLRRS